ncbi:MAG: 16S rRNA (cytosine(1402)-N(4))-methyltransferase RsmH [Bacteroidales bacterium]|nr:16S rRNA (cytosine(1402)-N(4))-methyltransferase RsmH [Bacteroidales bacterium]
MKAYHIPVLLKESIDGLKINPEGTYVDVTYGGGGHSREILKKLTTGRLIAFDQDKDALINVINDEHLLFVNHNFRYLKNFLRYYNIGQVDGLLADLGVSSHHFDVAKRGFSYRYDGELDMRMNQKSSITAKHVLNVYHEKQLYLIFKLYGEIINTSKLVNVIVNYRKEKEIKTINQFKEVISSCMPKNKENKYLSKVFQALRIEVNGEVDSLKDLLLQSGDVIKKDGRLVVITYHSIEDRLVKNYIKKGKFEGEVEKDFYGNIQVPFKAVNKKVIIPNEGEIETNVRSRSAKLRIAQRV